MFWKDKSNEVRWAAVYSLALIRDESAIFPIVVALRDPDKYVRSGAAAALDMFGWEPEEIPTQVYYYIAIITEFFIIDIFSRHPSCYFIFITYLTIN